MSKIANIKELTDNLIKEVCSGRKQAGERTICDGSSKKNKSSGSKDSKEKEKEAVKVEVAESLRKTAQELNNLDNLYDISYKDVSNYLNRF